MSLFWKALGPVLLLAGLSGIAMAQTPVSFSTHTQSLATQSFTDVTNALAVDLNNDGVPDLVVCRNAELYDDFVVEPRH